MVPSVESSRSDYMVIDKQKTTINVAGESFLDKMLNGGESPNKCAVWCIKRTASVPTMYEYAKKHRATIIGDVQADKRRSRKSKVKLVAIISHMSRTKGHSNDSR